MKPNAHPAIVLLSGGLDSTTCLAIAREEGFLPIYTMAFDYGQRHRHELAAAERIARHFGVNEHRVIRIDLRQFGGSALTADIAVPKNRSESEMAGDVPITYVPARNTIFLSYALGWAEVMGVRDIFIGVNALDYSGYPDCRPEFIAAYERLANLATKMTTEATGEINSSRPYLIPEKIGTGANYFPALKIHAPLIQLTKAQIVRRGIALGIDYGMTHSCYDPDRQGRACGHCDSCLLRKKGFAEAGVPDPTVYAG